ncbi:MAG: DUF2157 domain-containing protein [Candidatus Vogelbacteria bacterium]|nr:DUF2157 domain-containing protein [Candidatus Vogelbacteria bacterium]
MHNKKGMASFGSIVAMIGSILIACGVAWLIATNWHQMPSIVKIIILLFATVGSYVAGIFLRMQDYEKIGKSLIVLGALLYTLSIFLIAQIFSTDVSIQGTAFLLLLAWIGVYITSYIFDSPTSLVVALVELIIWIGLQYVALIENNVIESYSLGMFALIYLFVGVLFYGLSLLHKSFNHSFARLYRWWTAFYFLTFAYILSFQTLLPLLWPAGLQQTATTLVFLVVLALISLIVAVVGILKAIEAGKVKPREVAGFIIVGILLIILIAVASSVSGKVGTCSVQNCYDLKTKNQCETTPLPDSLCQWQSEYCQEINCYAYQNQTSCQKAPAVLKCAWTNDSWSTYCVSNRTYYEYGQDPVCSKNNNDRESCVSNSVCKWNPQYYYGRSIEKPLSLWFVWIFANIIFLALILLIVGYGTWQRSSGLVNLGVFAFAVDIITRYIGFIIDIGWYTSLSIIFITGGIILIFGGWMIERWRRNLIAKANA